MNTDRQPRKYLVHPGTGTIIDIYDDCWVIDADAIPHGTDLEELASTEFLDLPLDIPAQVPRLTFDYLISDFRNDWNDFHNEGVDNFLRRFPADLLEYAGALADPKLGEILSYAMDTFVEHNKAWDVWYSCVKHAMEFQQVIDHEASKAEPF